MACGLSICGLSNDDYRGGCGNIVGSFCGIVNYLIPVKINTEKETVKFRTLKVSQTICRLDSAELLDDTLKYSFKEIRSIRKNNPRIKIAGIKIKKDGEIKFTSKYKDEIKNLGAEGKKALKKIKKLKEEMREDKTEEEDFER